MQNSELTQREFWDNYWAEFLVPAEIKKSRQNLYQNEILRVFDTYLPSNNNLSILEIGGAPGQYLAYMHKSFGYVVSSLDYSELGCKKTKENFDLLHISGHVFQADLFSEELTLPQFDIVYSLGFIEHFSDLNMVIEKHLRLLKPGGVLLIGTPNFHGINHFFSKRLFPKELSAHNLATMDIRNWTSFEENFGLEIVFKGYVGGFEPRLFWGRCENINFLTSALTVSVYALSFFVFQRFRILRKVNSRHISGYAIGVFRKPAF